jgi:translation initiation factor 3 subunit C
VRSCLFYRKIQEEGLRTYLFTYAPYYDSLSLDLLAATFSLPRGTVTAIASKMIWSEELVAALDQIDGVVVFHRVEQSRVQQLAQELASKVCSDSQDSSRERLTNLTLVAHVSTD